MSKQSKISFRVSKDLKTYLSDNALGCDMSLTNFCIWILESYQKGEDITGSTDTERVKGNARLKESSLQFETDKNKMLSDIATLKKENEALKSENSRIIVKHHEQNTKNVKHFQNAIKEEVNKAFQRGLDSNKTTIIN